MSFHLSGLRAFLKHPDDCHHFHNFRSDFWLNSGSFDSVVYQLLVIG
jgi:hypothetical protein